MGRWLVDTNILLRIQEEGSHEAALAQEALARLGEREDIACVTPQVLVEFWCAMTRPAEANGLGWNPEDTGKRIEEIRREFELLKDNENIFPRWLSLVSHYGRQGKQVHDARLVAVMLTHGVTNLLTYNFADFKSYTEITAVSPADIVQSAK